MAAIAGRNADKLAEVPRPRRRARELPLLVADASDRSRAGVCVARQSRHHDAGPVPALRRAARGGLRPTGTDYVDLCGEPGWMAQMIGLLEAGAAVARIVFSCGFDSIPFDLGVVFRGTRRSAASACRSAGSAGGCACSRAEFSGGTAASLLATVEAMSAHCPSRARWPTRCADVGFPRPGAA